MIFHKELQFQNVFTQESDQITLTWDFQDGFLNNEHARKAVKEAGQNPELFLYIKHHGFVYPIAANGLAEGIVITPETIWYRIPNSEYINSFSRDTKEKIPYVMDSFQSSDFFKITMCQDLSAFDPDMRMVLGKDIASANKAYKDYCVATLGAIMVDTMISSYQLNSMEPYFKNISSFLQLWEIGVKEFNPFNGHRNMAPFSLQAYLNEKITSQEEIQQLTTIRNLLQDLGVMNDLTSADTVRLPTYLGRKLVLVINALLSDMGDSSAFSSRNYALKKILTKSADPDLPKDTEERSYKFCRICHISLPNDSLDNICPACKEQELFVAVKDFIRENDVNENDVVEHFDISLSKVRSWIREGRISYKEMRGIRTQKEGTSRVCKECGMILPPSWHDSICKTCKDLAEATRNRSKNKYSINAQNQIIENDTMHYGRKHN